MGIHEEVDKTIHLKSTLEDADAAINYNRRLAEVRELLDRLGVPHKPGPKRTPEEAEARRAEIEAFVEELRREVDEMEENLE